MHTWIDQAAEKVVNLNKELADLRKRYAIASKNSSVGLEALRVLTNRATEAAERSGKAAAKSLIAARQVANVTKDPTSHMFLISSEEAEIAAETAIKFAAEATKLVQEVLMAARTVAANDKNATLIKDSMISVLITIRSAEAATAATRLAQSVTALASSLSLTRNY